jgi:hypothetical protein
MISKKRVFVAAAILLILGLIVGLVSLTVGPRTIRLINLSGFTSPPEMGSLSYTRLRPKMDQTDLVAIGMIPEQELHGGVVVGFLTAWSVDGNKPLRILLEEGYQVPQLPSHMSVERFRMKEPEHELNQRIRNLLDANQRVALVTHSYYVSHVLPTNPLKRLEVPYGSPIVSLSLLGFAASSDEMQSLSPPCVGQERDSTGLVDLGCMLRHRSMYLARRSQKVNKNSNIPNPFLGALEQTGAFDYTLFTHQPL